MRSPRFHLRQKDLQEILSIQNLKRVWRDKVRIALRRSYIQDPIDALDFHIALDANCHQIRTAVCEGNYSPTSKRRLLIEKSKGLCRQIVVANIKDAIVLQVLSDALYAVIKNKIRKKNSFFAPEDNRFSQAFKSTQGAPRYGSLRAWLDFQKTILQFARTREYVVVTDIANYYDFISYAHLRNTIVRLGITSETVLDLLIFTLAGLLWQPDYMPRVELGLPQMDLDAPRMLAHCFLCELDEFIEQTGKYDFARFMDDIDVGADTMADAKTIIRDIDLILQTRQVRLNSGKTKILTRAEALTHFKVIENSKLDELSRTIDEKKASGESLGLERSNALALYRQLVRAKVFNSGYGDKILKRILGLCGELGVSVPLNHLALYLDEWPSVRPNVLTYLTKKNLNRKRLELIENFLCTSTIVDDAAYLDAAYAVNECVIRQDFGAEKIVERIVSKIANTGMAGFYASLWLLSKHADARILLGFLRENFDIWRTDDDVGRLVGGLWPIIRGAGLSDQLDKLANRARNAGVLAAKSFHESIAADQKIVTAIRPILKSTNSSKPLKVTHAKFLMLLSLLQNEGIPEKEKAAYINAHRGAWADIFYAQRARELPISRALRRLI